uniref:Uncharacterized protein n=1 Tax=Salix viminalis TaxID=40686 RepID=A0A6N2NAL8_SALVM
MNNEYYDNRLGGPEQKTALKMVVAKISALDDRGPTPEYLVRSSDFIAHFTLFIHFPSQNDPVSDSKALLLHKRQPISSDDWLWILALSPSRNLKIPNFPNSISCIKSY